MNYQSPILTVDVVAMRLQADGLESALIHRPEAPFEGVLSIPGGFVHTDKDENTDATALRVLAQKLSFTPTHLEQVFTASGAGRDPRGWSASVVYLALVPLSISQVMTEQKPGLVWVPVDGAMPPMAFDHNALVRQCVQRLRAKAEYSSIVGHLLEEFFVMSDLHQAHQVLLRRKIDRANFRRKTLELGGIIPLGIETTEGQKGRPSERYRMQKEIVYA
jgi:8-oxo-dGTP diphosphatase